jgi:predicted DNA-binding transcriptional regulator AlpA
LENAVISSVRLRTICGGVSDMTVWRWLHDPELDFPQPIYIRRRRYWHEAEILAWIAAQAKTSAKAAA